MSARPLTVSHRPEQHGHLWSNYDLDIFFMFELVNVLTLHIYYWLGVHLFKKVGHTSKGPPSIIP